MDKKQERILQDISDDVKSIHDTIDVVVTGMVIGGYIVLGHYVLKNLVKITIS